MGTPSKVGHHRFARASTAVLFAVDQLSPKVLRGTLLEVDEERFNAAEINLLYDHVDFPPLQKTRR